MAIPVLQQTNFSPLFQAQQNSLESQRYASQGLVNLGKQISLSIQTNNARKEAEAAQPLLAATYQSGLNSILNDDIPTGLSAIFSVNSQFGDNPILAPSLEAMNRTAGILTNSVLQGARMNQEYALRGQLQEDEQAFRAGQGGQQFQQPATEEEKLRLLKNFDDRSEQIFSAMANERDPEKYLSLKSQYDQLKDGLIGLGAPVFEGNAPMYVDEENIGAIQQIDKDIQNYSREVGRGNIRPGPDFVGGLLGQREFSEVIKDLKTRKDLILKRAQKALRGTRPSTQPIMPGQAPAIVTEQSDFIEGDLPNDPSVPGIDLTQQNTDIVSPGAGYVQGRKYAGLTYMGGDPNDQSNWSK